MTGTRNTRGTPRQKDVAAGNIRKAEAAEKLKKRTDLAKKKKMTAKVPKKKAQRWPLPLLAFLFPNL
jgi:hypothetical protein